MPNVTFYQLTQFFNSLALNHPNITTFTIGDLASVDLAKETLYPLLHMVPNNVIMASGIFTYNFDLIMMDRVTDITNLSTGNFNTLIKNYKDITNVQDVWDSTLLTLNDIISYVTRQPLAANFIIVDNTIATPFQDNFNNLLAGWTATLNVQTPNDVNMCVFDLTLSEAQGNDSTAY